jgi:hypothetical protein
VIGQWARKPAPVSDMRPHMATPTTAPILNALTAAAVWTVVPERSGWKIRIGENLGSLTVVCWIGLMCSLQDRGMAQADAMTMAIAFTLFFLLG